jgi:hypothetical protein
MFGILWPRCSPLPDLLQANVLKNLRALNLLDIPTELSSPPSLMLNLENVPVPQVNVFEKLEYLSIAYSSGVLLEKSYAPSLRMLVITRDFSNCEENPGLFPETLERLCVKVSLISPKYDQVYVSALSSGDILILKTRHKSRRTSQSFWKIHLIS